MLCSSHFDDIAMRSSNSHALFFGYSTHRNRILVSLGSAFGIGCGATSTGNAELRRSARPGPFCPLSNSFFLCCSRTAATETRNSALRRPSKNWNCKTCGTSTHATSPPRGEQTLEESKTVRGVEHGALRRRVER